jgi:hypothetical protein
MPVSPSDIKDYNPNDWYITNKLDGERFLIYYYSGKVYRISRKCDILELPKIKYNLVKNEVFDVELFNNQYYVLDYHSDENRVLPFYKRLQMAKKASKTRKIDVVFKKFATTKPESLDTLIAEQKKLGIDLSENEGYIFTRKLMPVRIGTTKDIFKWKPIHLNTIDFMYKNGKIWIKTKDGLQWIQESDVLFDKSFNGCIMEYYPKVSKKTKRVEWYFMRHRKDKNVPNFESTFISTLKNIHNFKSIEKYMK